MRRAPDLSGTAEDGSALILALAFLSVFGLVVGAILQLVGVDLKATTVIRARATTTYAADGGVDGAINYLRQTSNQQLGVDPGTGTPWSSNCFNLPASSVMPAVSVQCESKPGSGAGVSSAANTVNNTPANAVLSGLVAPDPNEGVNETATANIGIQGPVQASPQLVVPTGATLTSSTSISAANCPSTPSGTITPSATCPVTAAVDPVRDTTVAGVADTWPGIESSGAVSPATPLYPGIVQSVPACSTPLVQLTPGTYRSFAALSVFNCPNTVIWLPPGDYYFDFQDTGTHDLVLSATNSVVVAGTPLGWTPGVTLPTNAVFTPAIGGPPTAPTACDATKQGVRLVFSGDDRLTLSGERTEICGFVRGGTAGGATDNQQHIALWAPSTDVPTTSDPNNPSLTTATLAADVPVGGGRSWATPGNGAVVDGATSYVKVPNVNSPYSDTLQAGPFATPVVPTDATNISIAVSIKHTMNGTGISQSALDWTSGGTGTADTAWSDVATCPASSGCANQTFATGPTFPGVTVAQANGFNVLFRIYNPNNQPIETWIDGVTVTVNFTAPFHAATLTAPYSGTSSSTHGAVLRTIGSSPSLVIRGTIYAPNAAIDLEETNVGYTVVDRGIAARDVKLAMTPAAAYTKPILIAIPSIAQSPRDVLLLAYVAGMLWLRSDVTFTDATGTTNGGMPHALSWSLQ
jgi:hypothetical protein